MNNYTMRLRVNDSRLFASPNSIAVIEKLEENGHEAVFVGGSVRDFYSENKRQILISPRPQRLSK